MKRFFTLAKSFIATAVVVMFLGTAAHAQVTVTGSNAADGPYATVGDAFTAINANSQTGMTIGILISGNTLEPVTAQLNADNWTAVGITAVAPVTVSGNIVGAVVRLNGADNVTIDGQASRFITIQNTSTSSLTAALWVSSAGAGLGATNNAIRNCNFICGTDVNSNGNTSFGIISSGATITATLTLGGNDNDNNQYTGNTVEKCRYGIFVNGISGNRDVATLISGNIVGPAAFGVNNIGKTGILLSFQDGATVTLNTVQNVGVSAAMTGGGVDRYGIALGNEAWGSTPGVPASSSITNTTVSRNLIHDIIEEKTFSCVGIYLSAGTAVSTNTVCSNMLYNVRGNGTAGDQCVGIGVGSGNGDMIVHNTVSLTGDFDPGAAITMTQTVCGFRIGGTGTSTTNIHVKNNIFYMDVTSNTNIVCVATTVPSTTYAFGTGGMDNNDYYFPAINSFMRTAGTGTGAVPTVLYVTLPNFQAALTPAQNAASIQLDPVFISASDLHINVSSTNVDNVGTPVACAVDFDGDPRSATTPDIGADEYVAANCTVSDAGTITPSTATVCAGLTYVMTASGVSTGAGTTHQWQFATVSGGPYSNVVGGSGATTPTYTTAVLTAGTYYYVLQTTCAFSGPSSDLSNELTLTVNPSPTVNVSPTAATYCNPGPAIALTASGTAIGYSWGPAAGLSATTGANVNASPTVTTTYTVTGIDGNGCTATATTTISSENNPILNASATPSSVCSGGNSQLLAIGSVPALVRDYTFSTSTGATLDPMVGATTLIGTNVDDTPISTQNIGFTFNYNGTNYTQFATSPDGWIMMGGAAAVNQFTNQVTSAANIPKIYPYWDDAATGTTGNVTMLVTGSAPNRIMIVQWFTTVPYNTTGAANSTYQCWLYESTNVIEFRYGTMGVATSGTISAGLTGSPTNFNCITIAANTASNSVANDANTATPAVGRMYTFTPPATTFAWSPGTFLNSTTIANPMASGVTTTTSYTVTATAPLGCTSTATVTVTTGAALTASGSISPGTTVCAGTNITLNSTPTGGGAPYTYAWTGPNGFNSTAQNPVRNGVTVADGGTYTLVITDNCAATFTVNLTLTVNPQPAVTVTPLSALFCSGGPGVSITASGDPATYSWGPAAGLSSTTGANVTASPTVTTTYTATATDGNGCSSTATTTINYGVTPAPTASANPATICANGTSTLTVVPAAPLTYCQPVYSTGTGFGDYVSSVVVNTLNSPSGASPTPYYTLFPASGNTTTTLTAGTTYTITLVAGTFTQNDLAAWIDYNQNGTLNNAGEKLGETDNLGATPASTSFVFTVPVGALNGTTRLRVRDMDHGGTNDMDPCAAQSAWGETEDYIITIVGGVDPYLISWSPATFLNSTTIASPVASSVTATTTYTVVVTGAEGCTGSASTTVNVNALPTVTATATPSTVCAGDMVTATGGGATSYTWTGGIMDNVPFAAMSTQTYTVTGTDANGCSNTASTTVTVNALPTVTATATPSTVCEGDMVTATGGGATSYVWTGGIMDNVPFAAMSTQTYTVTGTDANGCSNTASTTVTVNALPTVTASATPSTVCTGDMVTPNGGGAASYTWTGGIMDNVPFAAMSTQTYTVTGTDANGCSDTASTTVTVNALPTVSASVTPSTACVGDMVTPAGSGAATYVWTGGLTDGVAFPATVSDTYTVTGTDANGCSGTTTVSLVVNTLPAVTASASDSTVCAGDSVTFTGGGASTYTWNNGVTDGMPYSVMASDTFIVTGTDANGCMNNDSVMVAVNALPTVTLSLPLDTACLLLGPVTLGGESPAGGTWSGPGVTGNSFNPGAAGNGMHGIMYTYMDSATGCSATAVDSMLVDICNDVAGMNNATIQLYPNPNNGDFTLIPAGSGVVDVMIYSATGQLVHAQKANAGQINAISLDASGMYSIVIVAADGSRTTQRVIVNR